MCPRAAVLRCVLPGRVAQVAEHLHDAQVAGGSSPSTPTTFIGGIAVNTAARVMSQAGPHEVVVSSTVKDLVAGSGIEFEDRGEHELKGVPGMWRLFLAAS